VTGAVNVTGRRPRCLAYRLRFPRRLGTTLPERLVPSQRSAVRRPFRRAPAVREQMIQARAGLVAELGIRRPEADGAGATLAH